MTKKQENGSISVRIVGRIDDTKPKEKQELVRLPHLYIEDMFPFRERQPYVRR